jgi:cob(I)alamin adenosyltransferase
MPAAAGEPDEALRVTPTQAERLEHAIERITARLEPLRSFVLPGGSPAAAWLHLARTVCRRAERAIVALARTPDETVNPHVIVYLNRLSDLLFVLARVANDDGKADVLWVPGQNRAE